MLNDKLEKVLAKKTPSQRRAFFRLLNHCAIEYRKGNELPPKIKDLIKHLQISEPPSAKISS
jgi:hypothetical protein